MDDFLLYLCSAQENLGGSGGKTEAMMTFLGLFQ